MMMPRHSSSLLSITTTLLLLLFTTTTTTFTSATPINSGTITMNINGVDTQIPVFSNGRANVNGRSLGTPYNVRAYLGRKGQSQFNSQAYYVIPLLGNTLSYTIDMTTIAVGCNAAVYMVTMPTQASGPNGDFYCDANQVDGSWCAEMDLIEANAIAAAITPHKCDSPTGPCDKGGCSMNSRLTGNWFTVNGGQINPRQPFKQSFTFIGSNGQVTDIIATLTQGSVTHTETYAKCGTAYLTAMINDFKNGMVLVTSYWGASKAGDMSWLDGDKTSTCSGGGSFTISDISLMPAGATPCSPNPCQHGGTCDQGKCQCPTEWSGDANCTTAPNPCANNPCQNGGTCTPNGASAYTCNCPAAWQGDARCSTATPNPCSPNPCMNGGTCNQQSGACTCPAAWKGERCTTPVPTDPCSPNPCQNGGTCNQGTCTCPATWRGDSKCSTATPATLCSPNPCQNGGTCNQQSGACTCPAAWKGDKFCATATAVADPCSANPCSHGGTCLDDGTCQCPSAWQGDDTCSTATPTADACASSPCKHGGTCNKGKCTCPAAWQGDLRCSTATPVDDPCEVNPCMNGGTCVQGACICPAEWQGNEFCAVATGSDDACGNICDLTSQRCNEATFECETIGASAADGGAKDNSSTLTILIIVAAVVIIAVIGFCVCTQCSSTPKSPYPTSTGYDEMQDPRPQFAPAPPTRV